MKNVCLIILKLFDLANANKDFLFCSVVLQVLFGYNYLIIYIKLALLTFVQCTDIWIKASTAAILNAR